MENTLDSAFIEEHREDPHSKLASGWQRFFNYLIDLIAFYFLVFILAFIMTFLFGNIVPSSENVLTFVVLIIYFIYYVIFEQAFGKTIGKMITRTRVVNLNCEKPGLSEVALRTLCRFIPFDGFTFLGKEPIGWHDSISKTFVIRDRTGNEISGEESSLSN